LKLKARLPLDFLARTWGRANTRQKKQGFRLVFNVSRDPYFRFTGGCE